MTRPRNSVLQPNNMTARRRRDPSRLEAVRKMRVEPFKDANVGSLGVVGPERAIADGRFRAQTTPKDEELDPAEGALQFMPALSWEDREEKKTDVQPKRVHRIKSLFQRQQQESRTPISPVNSGSSSGYVGWPGTQDKRGGTVSLNSSYEDSTGSRCSLWQEAQAPATTRTLPRSSGRRSPAGLNACHRSRLAVKQQQAADWKKHEDNASSPGASLTSSAYMHEQDFDDYTQSLTADQLASNDGRLPPHRSFGAAAKGFSGLLDKTQDVPSLMDNFDSDSMASSKATSAQSYHRSAESDVFDGITTKESDVFDNLEQSPRKQRNYPHSIAEEQEEDGEGFQLIPLPGGLAAIQSTDFNFANRQTASDYDDNLTNSEIDNNGFVRLPDLKSMAQAGRSVHDSSLHGIHGNFPEPSVTIKKSVTSASMMSSSDEGSSMFTDPYENESSYLDVGGDLSEYYVHPRVMKLVLRRYRRLSERVNCDLSLADFERVEDNTKALAMSEMRSRVMEKDIERDLERRGGTVVVDDMVTTAYFQAGLRVRDACIVSKAWRDGATTKDVMNSALMTRREHGTHMIRRPLRSGNPGINSPFANGAAGFSRRYKWEAVRWLDDADFMRLRCPSLGPRNMRGFEMFTVGDCQSMLLKLTNDQCMELRTELNDATRRQIEAEDLMKKDGGAGEDTMTSAEMAYLEAMEEVKTISKKLVSAEQSFALVRDRIQELVNRYQSLLVKIESDSVAGASSVLTCQSSLYSENDSEYWDEQNELERSRWARRARRAEIRAEVAAREALMAKEEARLIQEEKQRELDVLQQKLNELQSDPSTTISRERANLMARSFNQSAHSQMPADISQNHGTINKERLDGVKQRFRERIAAKKRAAAANSHVKTPSPVKRSPAEVTPSPPSARDLIRAAGEEMYQHLDFYERSLHAVDKTRDPM